MDKDVRASLYTSAKKWVYEAGQKIREEMTKPMTVTTKSNPNDLVTTVDKNTEKFFAERIRTHYPDHLILGEEGYGDDVASLDGTVWIIDPIDGTMNFVHLKRNFAISIGIYHDGVGEIGLIYDVMGDILYEAIRDEGAHKNGVKLLPLSDSLELRNAMIGLNHFWLCENKLVDEKVMQSLIRTVRGSRATGSAALEMAYVAEGVYDAYLALGLSPWDIAAGIVIINEVGGVITNHLGEQLDLLRRNSLIVGNRHVQEPIIKDFIHKGKK